MPMFGGSKDDYCKDVVPPNLLVFDRVNEGESSVIDFGSFQAAAGELGNYTAVFANIGDAYACVGMRAN